MYFPFFVGVMCLSLFCYALLCVFSSFTIILKRKRELVALHLLSYGRLVAVNANGAAVCVIVAFLDHTHLLFVMKLDTFNLNLICM